MKKLLFILPSLGIGGTLSSFISLYNWIKDENYQISVIALNHQGEGRDLPFLPVLRRRDTFWASFYEDYSLMSNKEKIASWPTKALKQIDNRFKLHLLRTLFKYKALLLEKENFDYVVAFQEDLPTAFAALFTRTKKIAWIHCNYKFRYKALSRSELPIYSQFDKIVNVSEFTKRQFIEIYPSLEPKCVSIYNIIDINKIKQLSNEYETPEYRQDCFNIVSVGRISRVKRFSEIPEIVNELKNCSRPVRWVVVGPVIDSGEYSLLQGNITKYGADNVVLVGGKSNPYPYIKKADLLVCLSESEACPMVFNEAKILGTPIITTDFESACEFVNENVDGVIYPIDEIACGIKRCIDSNRCDKYNPDENIMRYYNLSICDKFNSLFE